MRRTNNGTLPVLASSHGPLNEGTDVPAFRHIDPVQTIIEELVGVQARHII